MQKSLLRSPNPEQEYVLIWKEPSTNKTRYRPASNDDLLALKIVADGIDPLEAARDGKVPVGLIDRAIDNAVRNGILLSPEVSHTEELHHAFVQTRMRTNVSLRLTASLFSGI